MNKRNKILITWKQKSLKKIRTHFKFQLSTPQSLRKWILPGLSNSQEIKEYSKRRKKTSSSQISRNKTLKSPSSNSKVVQFKSKLKIKSSTEYYSTFHRTRKRRERWNRYTNNWRQNWNLIWEEALWELKEARVLIL